MFLFYDMAFGSAARSSKFLFAVSHNYIVIHFFFFSQMMRLFEALTFFGEEGKHSSSDSNLFTPGKGTPEARQLWSFVGL
jgi:hypothetical protein